ncbi:hypothetical protein TNCV_1938571 [Trichonephila clavipes]|nr:hypothetical protein TNCV_1938571 [Trichonephila clavipes]
MAVTMHSGYIPTKSFCSIAERKSTFSQPYYTTSLKLGELLIMESLSSLKTFLTNNNSSRQIATATATASSAIPATSQDTKQTSKPRGGKRPPKNRSNNINPKMEIEMAPCDPRKSAPVEYTAD